MNKTKYENFTSEKLLNYDIHTLQLEEENHRWLT